MSGIDRRGVLRIAGVTGLAALGGGCGADSEPRPGQQLYDNHVRIGLLVPVASGHRSIGDEIVNGFNRFLSASGNRLGGHPYLAPLEDEGESPGDATAALERLLDQDVQAVVGVASGDALREISQTVADQQVPLLTAHAALPAAPETEFLWCTSYLSHEPGLALGVHLAGEGEGPVVVIAPTDAAGEDLLAGLAGAPGSDGLLAEPIRTAANSQPGPGFFGPALAQLRAMDPVPVAVVAAYAGAAAVTLLREYAAAGLDPQQLYGPPDLTEAPVLAELGADLAVAVVGVRTSGNYSPELRVGENQSFAVAYRNQFNRTPTGYAVAGYDAAAALDRAIRLTQGRPTRLRLNDRLGQIGVLDSPRGPWQFNQEQAPTQRWYLREVAADGPVVTNVVVKELGTLG